VSLDRDRDGAAVRGVVDRVAAAYGAETVLADAELGRGAGGSRGVRVLPPASWGPDVRPADMVVSFDAPARGAGWDEYLLILGKQARKALVVFARNAERLGGRSGPDTAALAGILWQVGRVREHAYLGVPRLLGASGVVQAPAGRLVRRTARWHAFVVDTAPRTPQARRRLRAVDQARSPEDP